MFGRYRQPHGNVQPDLCRVTQDVFPSFPCLTATLWHAAAVSGSVCCQFWCAPVFSVCSAVVAGVSGQVFVCLLGGGVNANPRACCCGLYPSSVHSEVSVCLRLCIRKQEAVLAGFIVGLLFPSSCQCVSFFPPFLFGLSSPVNTGSWGMSRHCPGIGMCQ